MFDLGLKTIICMSYNTIGCAKVEVICGFRMSPVLPWSIHYETCGICRLGLRVGGDAGLIFHCQVSPV